MVSRFFASIAFTLCGLVFTSLVLIMYLNKRRINKQINSFFLFFLIYTILMLLVEFLYVYAMTLLDQIPLFANIACRLYLSGMILWMIFLFYYVGNVAIQNYEDEERKKKIKKRLIMFLTPMFFISVTLANLLKIEYFPAKNKLYSFGGSAIYVAYVVGAILIICTLAIVVKSRAKVQKSQKASLIVMIIMLIAILVTELSTGYDYNTTTFLFSIVITTLYFTVENQDSKKIEELDRQRLEAEEANETKTEFLANMSHEIRTPMNTILGFSEGMLSEKVLTPEMVKKDTKNIHDASVTLLELINNILDISRIESEKEEVIEKEYDLKNLVFEVDSIFKAKINKEEVSYEVQVDPNLPKRYYGDSGKITKILVNILINALKYTNYGNITLDIHQKAETEEGKFAFEIVISNTGHAMQESTFNISFNDFVKMDDKSETTLDSVSLGLIVAKRLIEMIGGNIEFKNEPNHGTRYIFTIEQKIINEEKVGNIYEENTGDAIEERYMDLTGKKILIVDDNKMNIRLATRLLEGYHAQIDSANNGSECVDMAKATKYDVIFLDHMMPIMDGVATLKALKSTGFTVPPVIALTANSYSGIREKYISEGFDDYLAKPISAKDLSKIIHNVFDKEKTKEEE